MSGSIGQIMNPGTVAPINVPEQQVNAMKPAIGYAQLQAAQLQPGLIGAQTAETQARANIAIPALANLQSAQAGIQPYIGQEAAARAGLMNAQIGAGLPQAEAANLFSTAGKTQAETFPLNVQNRQISAGESLTAPGLGYMPGQRPPGMVPLGPEVQATDVPTVGASYLRAVQPSESPPVPNILNHNGHDYTFDPSNGHPGVGHAGLYQLGPQEWAQGAAALGINPKDFSQPNQESVAWYTAKQRYAQQYPGRDLATDLAKGANPQGVLAVTQQIWPSVTGGSQENLTGASFAQRLPLTLQHEPNAAGKVPPTGVPGPVTRAAGPGVQPATWNGIPVVNQALPPKEGEAPQPPTAAPIPPDLQGRAVRTQSPAGPDLLSPNGFFNQAINSLPVPKSYLVQGDPKVPLAQRAQEWNTKRQTDIPNIFNAAAGPDGATDPVAFNRGLDAIYNTGLIFGSQRQALLNHPEQYGSIMQGQLPLAEQAATKAAAATATTNVGLIAQTREKFAQAADSAQQQNAVMNQMLAYQGAAGSGPLSPDLARIGGVLSQAGEAIGLGPSRAVSDWAQLQSLQSDLLRAKVVGTGNVRAQSEWNILNRSVLSLSDPSAAFRVKGLSTQAMNDYTQAKAASYAGTNMVPDQFETRWNDFVDPMAFIVKRLMVDPAGQAAATQIHNQYVQNGQQDEWKRIVGQVGYITRNGIYGLAPVFRNAQGGGPQ